MGLEESGTPADGVLYLWPGGVWAGSPPIAAPSRPGHGGPAPGRPAPVVEPGGLSDIADRTQTLADALDRLAREELSPPQLAAIGRILAAELRAVVIRTDRGYFAPGALRLDEEFLAFARALQAQVRRSR